MWLLIVLFSAWIGQLAGKQIVDSTLSGFVGAAVMVPVAHAVAHARNAPPAHVMFLPAFWMLVPGAIGLIGVTEIVGNNADVGSANFQRCARVDPGRRARHPGRDDAHARGEDRDADAHREAAPEPATLVKEGRLATVDAQCCVHTPGNARTHD